MVRVGESVRRRFGLTIARRSAGCERTNASSWCRVKPAPQLPLSQCSTSAEMEMSIFWHPRRGHATVAGLCVEELRCCEGNAESALAVSSQRSR